MAVKNRDNDEEHQEQEADEKHNSLNSHSCNAEKKFVAGGNTKNVNTHPEANFFLQTFSGKHTIISEMIICFLKQQALGFVAAVTSWNKKLHFGLFLAPY